MKRLLVVSFALVGFLAGTQLLAEEKDEPTYEGKPLAYWIKQLRQCEKRDDRMAAANVIGRFGADAVPAIPMLVKMLADHSPDFRETAGGILCDLGPEARSAVPALTALLKDNKARSPEIVIKILGCIGPDAREAVPVLLEALKDKDRKREAVTALGSIGQNSRTVVPAIRQAIRDEGEEQLSQPWHRNYSNYCAFFLDRGIAALTSFGVDGVPGLVEILKMETIDRHYRTSIAQSLGKIGPGARSSVTVLTRLLQEESNAEDRIVYAETLGKIGPAARDSVPSLVKLLESKSAWLRLAAAKALWQIEKHAQVVPALIEVWKEKGKEVVSPGGQIATGWTESEAAKEAPRFQTLSAIAVLGEIGSPAAAALPELKKALYHVNEGVRRAAAEAIRQIDLEQGRKIKLDQDGKVIGTPFPGQP